VKSPQDTIFKNNKPSDSLAKPLGGVRRYIPIKTKNFRKGTNLKKREGGSGDILKLVK
jgi:hypothetical protein